MLILARRESQNLDNINMSLLPIKSHGNDSQIEHNSMEHNRNMEQENELIHLLNQHKARIIAIQETTMTTNYLYKIPKYTLIAKDGTLNHRNHGGVAMYINE